MVTSTQMGRRSGMAGFTMLEFTNSVSAFMMLVAATVSGVYDFILDNERCTVVNQLLIGLRLARSAANEFDQTITVCPSADGGVCSRDGNWSRGWVAFVDLNGDGLMQREESRFVVARARNPGDRVRIVSGQPHYSFVPLYERGFGAASPAEAICINDEADPRHGRVIVLDGQGRARLVARRPAREIAENAARDFSHRSQDCF